MTGLNQKLLNYIRHEVRVALSKSVGSSLRLVFSSPPKSYLADLFEFITSEGVGLQVEIQGRQIEIPTYLLDNDVEDPSERKQYARCTPTYLTTIRNMDFPVWLVLQEVSANANRSLETTSVPIGIFKEIRGFEEWIAAPIVEYLVTELLREFGFDESQAKHTDTINFVLRQLWEVDEGRKEKQSIWDLFNKLFSRHKLDAELKYQFLAQTGFPYCEAGEFGNNFHLNILGRLSDLFQAKGLRGGFDELEANADKEKLQYVKEMRAHVEDQGVIEANDFSRNPLGVYSPTDVDSEIIPKWWYELDLATWIRLLDSEEPPEPGETILEVSVQNVLSSVPKGMFPITLDNVHLEISAVDEGGTVEFVIEKSNGSAPFQEIYSSRVMSGSPVDFTDEDISNHERFIRYRISGERIKPNIIKVIVLEHYNPGVVVLNQGAVKASPFRMNKRATTEKDNRKISRYECDISLPGMGSHILDCFVSSSCEISEKIFGYEVDAEQSGTVEKGFSKISEHHFSCLIETDEECYYEFTGKDNGSGKETPYRIYISADDVTQAGANSEFERLITMNRASASGSHESPRVFPLPCRVMELEVWAQENPNSFRPLILGPDIEDLWKKPEWKFEGIFSNLGLPIDPRPQEDSFTPPEKFISARNQLVNFMRSSDDNGAQPAAAIKLFEHMRDESFERLVADLLDAYLDWLSSDYDNAAWSDLVCIHSSQSNAKALESTPYAVLMTPLHPIKLAWQCCAQTVLQEALDKHSRCPAGSVMNPDMFPDCFVLPCRTATGSIERKGYVSLASSSDYWGVLFSVDSSDLHELSDGTSIFGPDFGIEVEGLSSGFSSQQVVRSLDETERLLSAKASLRVRLSSDTSGSSSCNDGIHDWCLDHLGEDRDEWNEAGSKSLIIEDFRERGLQPEQAVLASLTAKSNATVSWFRAEDASTDHKADLSIIAHLSTMSRDFDNQGIRSAIDETSLLRWRVRKQLPGQNAAFIAESRIGEVSGTFDAKPVIAKLLGCVDELERQCRDTFDSYIFAPDLANLESVVRRSRYTALSSSDIDSACFFGTTSKAYLWDYELPSYSKRAGENTGYYLLASESPGILKAVRSALGLLGDETSIDDEKISTILQEISRRGMPTLKRLTTGGSMSVGELGMLVALRVFQSDFEPGIEREGLLPSRCGNLINIIVSADPFQRHYDDLRAALKFKSAERPDLLVLSVGFAGKQPVKMKLTSVEVKARNDALPSVKRREALGQAKSFSELLQAIQKKSEEVTLWGIAWRNLLATMLDYGFRVYGQLDKFMSHTEWAEQHSAILRSIAQNELDIEIDARGRLIIVEDSNDKSIHDVDGDGFQETIVLQHKEAFSILSRSDDSFTDTINQALLHWELTPKMDSSVEGESDRYQSESESVHEDQVLDAPDLNKEAVNNEEATPSGESTSIAQENSEQSVSPEEGLLDNEVVAATSSAGIRFSVGRTVKQFTEEDLYFFPSNTALNQLNVGIVGDLGTGKTQLIQALVHQLTNSAGMNRGKKPNMLIFDYKRDYSKPEFVEATGAKVISPFEIPLNLFDIRDSSLGRRAWLERSKFFIDVLNKLYSGIGAVQGQNIKDAVKAAYSRFDTESGQAPTINDVFDEYKGIVRSPDTPYSIMSDLVDGEYFVSNNSNVQPFSEFLDGVVVIDLSQVGQDDKTKNMLVVIFLNLFYEHMLKIEKRPFLGNEPTLRFVDTMLLVDEADNIMKYEFEVLKKILLQGREFGVGVLLASQYLSHFKTSHENYLEPLLSWFVHKVPSVTVRELEGIGLSRVNPDLVEQIKTLECHECLFKTLGVDGKIIRGRPFFELIEELG